MRAIGLKNHSPVQFKMEGTFAHDEDMFKLTTENYSYWKPMMEDHLYCKDLHEPITNEKMPEGKSEKDWVILNRKVVSMIRKYIDKSLFKHVNSTPDGKLSLDTITDSLLNEESRRKERGMSSHSEANVVENRGRSEHRSKGSRGKSQGRSKSCPRGLTCFYYGKIGHKKQECRFLKLINQI
ncbi:hypothetical protein CR513_19621, partial [Mucuna pruriens]